METDNPNAPDVCDWTGTKATVAQRRALHRMSAKIFPGMPRALVDSIIDQLNWHTAGNAIKWGRIQYEIEALVKGMQI